MLARSVDITDANKINNAVIQSRGERWYENCFTNGKAVSNTVPTRKRHQASVLGTLSANQNQFSSPDLDVDVRNVPQRRSEEIVLEML